MRLRMGKNRQLKSDQAIWLYSSSGFIGSARQTDGASFFFSELGEENWL
jgi:hypothetical protein